MILFGTSVYFDIFDKFDYVGFFDKLGYILTIYNDFWHFLYINFIFNFWYFYYYNNFDKFDNLTIFYICLHFWQFLGNVAIICLIFNFWQKRNILQYLQIMTVFFFNSDNLFTILNISDNFDKLDNFCQFECF